MVFFGGNETQYILSFFSRDNTVFLKISVFVSVFFKTCSFQQGSPKLEPFQTVQYLSHVFLFSAKVQPGVVGSWEGRREGMLLELKTEKCLSNSWHRRIPEFIAGTQVSTWCCSDDLTWLQLCNKGHDFIFVFWRIGTRREVGRGAGL